MKARDQRGGDKSAVARGRDTETTRSKTGPSANQERKEENRSRSWSVLCVCRRLVSFSSHGPWSFPFSLSVEGFGKKDKV